MIVLLLAAEDAARGGVENVGAMELNWLPAITSLVVFLLAFGFLYVAVWPKIIKGLNDREEKIRQEIANAEQAREQAKAALAKYEEELSSARREASEMIAKAREDAKAAAAELRDRNEAELVEMKQRATGELDNAKRAAITELHAETYKLAAMMATKILKREVSAEDQKRLVDESLQEMATAQDI